MRIKCEKCRKMIESNRSTDEKYYLGRRIVGYIKRGTVGIVKIAYVGGKSKKTNKKTLKFYCKECYIKLV